MTDLPLLGLGLLVTAVLGIALLELLLTRADVAAALVFGSVVVQAYFENVDLGRRPVPGKAQRSDPLSPARQQATMIGCEWPAGARIAYTAMMASAST